MWGVVCVTRGEAERVPGVGEVGGSHMCYLGE